MYMYMKGKSRIPPGLVANCFPSTEGSHWDFFKNFNFLYFVPRGFSRLVIDVM